MTVSCFLTGSSGARIGDRSPSVPSPAGVQRAWSHPIGMYTKPRRRTGLAGVLACAVAAGIIASSSGSARVAWRPFRNVRLGSAFLKHQAGCLELLVVAGHAVAINHLALA